MLLTSVRGAEQGYLTFREFLVCLALAHVLHMIPTLEERASPRSPAAPPQLAAAQAKEDWTRPDEKEMDSYKQCGDKKDGDEKESMPDESAAKSSRNNRVAALKVDCSSNNFEGAVSPVLSASGMFGHTDKLRTAFKTVMEAFMMFDADVTGTVSRANMMSTLRGMQQTDSPSRITRKHRLVSGGISSACSGATGFLTEERFQEMDWDGDGYITFKEFLMAFESWCDVGDEDEGDY